MTPYDGLLFFYLLALILIPAVVIGIMGRSQRIYGLIATALMLFLIFDTWEARLVLLGFYALETALVFGFHRFHRRFGAPGAFRPLLWVAVALAIAPLAIVKIGGLLPGGGFLRLLGVSYMTFRAVQVLIETHDGLIKELKFFDFTYFLLFFPSLSSGPIDRYRRFAADLGARPRGDYLKLLRRGVWKLLSGALFTFVFSQLISTYWLAPLPGAGFLPTLGYMYGYTFFLFFNFAGYSLMAIGTAYILGVKAPENFNQPFLALDLKDFWGRWHMSLSTWLRDYVYTRFTMASIKGEWFRDRRTGSYLGYLITMMTMGVWHGLSPHYLVYGAYHGALMCLNDVLDTRTKRFKKWKKHGTMQVLLALITFHLVAFGMLIFSGRLF